MFSWKINDNYAGGVPDLFLEGAGADMWVEVKYIKALPKRDTTILDFCHEKYLSTLQQKWLKRRYNRRKDCYVLVGCSEGSVLYRDLEWEAPTTVREFKQKVLTRKGIVSNTNNILAGLRDGANYGCNSRTERIS